MSFPKYSDLKVLTQIEDIEKELLVLQKSVFDLRMKKLTSQTVKPHLFLHAKRRIAQLEFKKSTLQKTA